MNKLYINTFIIFLAVTSVISCSAQQNNSKLKYSNFTVSEKNNKVAIDWSTEIGVPVNYFEIQKSSDGINFKTFALVLGPDPKKNDCVCYGCFDKISKGTSKHSYYRIRHIDLNGNEDLSESKMIAKL